MRAPTKPPHDFTAALLIAGRLITNALGQTVPEPRLRSKLRAMQLAYTFRHSTCQPLDEAQQKRIRELKSEGKNVAEIAKIIGTTYHRGYQVD
jgi:hypothetical protein